MGNKNLQKTKKHALKCATRPETLKNNSKQLTSNQNLYYFGRCRRRAISLKIFKKPVPDTNNTSVERILTKTIPVFPAAMF